MTAKTAWKVVKCTFKEFGEDSALRLSAALAYYTMFSLGPLLVIVVALASVVFGEDAVREQVRSQLQSFMGERASKILESMMSARREGIGVGATVLGIVALVFGATGVFGQLQDALNTIWEVKAKPKRRWWGFLRDRFLSFAMVMGIAFLLLISMVISTLLAAATGVLGNALPMPDVIAQLVNIVVSFGVVTLLFAMMFKYLPDVKIPWSKVWIGALGTSALFTLGKYLLALYLGRESTASAYGAAGSVIVTLMWIYYASVILFLGAEFTQVYTKETGAKLQTSSYAEPVTKEKRAEEGMKPKKTHARVRHAH